MTEIHSNKPTVFFDGSCPLCSKEIAHYQKCDGADQLHWLDITSERERLAEYGVDYDVAMQRFHVMSADGGFHTGAKGFVYLWSFLKPYRLLSKVVTKVGLVTPMDWAYGHFAKWRMRKQCTDNCQV